MQLEEANRTLQRDIGERRAVETALRESEARLARATAAGQIGIWDWDLTTGKLVWSRMHEELWGLKPGEFGGTYEEFRKGVHPDDRAALEKVVQQAIAERSEYQHEHRVVWPDGTMRWIAGRGTAHYDAEGRAARMSGVVIDITERNKLEQQFLRAQRMECIGALAGGIAHDMNNVLSPIMMSLAVLQMKFPDQKTKELLEVLSAGARRGADMIRQVLSFARGVEGRRMEVQIKHLIEEIEKIARDTFPKNIAVRTDIPHDLWTVIGDPTQIHQVLLNLCVNARDAMPDGGALVLSAENALLDPHYAGLNPEAKPGRYTVLHVEDSGAGMAAEIVDKIFDPFFTTKEAGKGTGLGLSTSLGIVKSHGGFIRVYSEPGNGTKFSVYLPAQTEPAGHTAAEMAAEMPRGNGELILVVDDESFVRQITQQTLETFDYRVIVASDGAEAASAYAARGSEIAAVLMDMMMPVLDGAATIAVLRRMNPEVRIIAASGLSANEPDRAIVNLGLRHVLTKPFTAETLLTKLRQVLDDELPTSPASPPCAGPPEQ